MIDWDAEVLADVAAEFGRAAVYTRAGGPAVAVTVILSRGDAAVGGFATKAVAEVARAEIRRAEVEVLAEGARLDIGADRYRISAPMLADDDRLIWSFGLERVA